MPRGKQAVKRVVAPDDKYHNVLLAKFINTVMKRGKKTTAQKIVYSALEKLQEKNKEDGIKVFEKVMNAVKPQVEVRSVRVGGANYQVPMPVSSDRQNALAFRWIIIAAKARKEKSMAEKLLAEMTDIMAGTGASLKKRDDVHRMAEANKAFAHFARRA